jgi:hypothetical protein
MILNIVFHVSLKNLDQFKFICERCNFAKLIVTKVYIKKIPKQILEWSKYKLGKLEGRSFWTLKIMEHKYMIKTFIQKFGM